MNDENRNNNDSTSYQEEKSTNDKKQSFEHVEYQVVKDLIRRLHEPESWPEEFLHISDEGEETPDIYSMIGILTSLRQEISLQGRSFHQLEASVKQWLDRPDPMDRVERKLDFVLEGFTQLESVIKSISEEEKRKWLYEEREKAQKETFDFMIEPLLDTHDQLARLLEQNQSTPKQSTHFLRSFFRPKSSDPVLETLALSLKKMEQRLNKLNIVPVAFLNGVFDPNQMKAVEKLDSTSHEQVTVIEVFRQGYKVNERILRYAEVKVADPKEPS